MTDKEWMWKFIIATNIDETLQNSSGFMEHVENLLAIRVLETLVYL